MRGRLVLLGALAALIAVAAVARRHSPPVRTQRAHPRLARPRTAARRGDSKASASAKPSPAAKPPPGPKVDVLAREFPDSASRCVKPPPPVPEQVITHRTWLTGVTITEYYPAPARWFTGRLVSAPGLPGRYPVDWLYSARGLAMEGNGVDLTGRPVHIAALGSTGWVDLNGHNTIPVCLGKWSHGFPVWLIGGWRNASGQVTYPLAGGGWANGRGRSGGGELPYGGVTFALGNSQPLRYYHSIAVDPRLIPLGSRVYIPAYRKLGGGWFIAQDTGGAIRGKHVDVYRPAPYSPDDLGRYMTDQRILVIPPSR